jgi:hypothetical protein
MMAAWFPRCPPYSQRGIFTNPPMFCFMLDGWGCLLYAWLVVAVGTRFWRLLVSSCCCCCWFEIRLVTRASWVFAYMGLWIRFLFSSEESAFVQHRHIFCWVIPRIVPSASVCLIVWRGGIASLSSIENHSYLNAQGNITYLAATSIQLHCPFLVADERTWPVCLVCIHFVWRLFFFFLLLLTGDALHSLRTNLNDPNNVLQSWDPTLVNPCTWFHVTCNNDNSVIRVYVHLSLYY